ncbi:hypothetical protein RISK_005508 [Rhodopirellula islandica]|uniref:Uncharacterized protein n=1 Tax=Rhodopirellula islandica TaxID=595434 RepID=A0A0J1B6V0_RHOIS|nr:hypothetical protein RISK_005508 [Rhodopirellula islandica]
MAFLKGNEGEAHFSRFEITAVSVHNRTFVMRNPMRIEIRGSQFP